MGLSDFALTPEAKEEIEKRRAEVAELDGKLLILRNVVDIDGAKWLPIYDKKSGCSPPGSQNCQLYGRVR